MPVVKREKPIIRTFAQVEAENRAAAIQAAQAELLTAAHHLVRARDRASDLTRLGVTLPMEPLQAAANEITATMYAWGIPVRNPSTPESAAERGVEMVVIGAR
jgi:hypothetical protein